MPIIQPSPKIQEQLGPGSTIHLKMQGEHITGIKEPAPVNQSQINRERGNELLMKQKVTPPGGSTKQLGVDIRRKPGGGIRASVLNSMGSSSQPKVKRKVTDFQGMLQSTRAIKKTSYEPPAAKFSTGVFSKIGRGSFCIGGEIIELKKIPRRPPKISRLSNPRKDPKPIPIEKLYPMRSRKKGVIGFSGITGISVAGLAKSFSPPPEPPPEKKIKIVKPKNPKWVPLPRPKIVIQTPAVEKTNEPAKKESYKDLDPSQIIEEILKQTGGKEKVVLEEYKKPVAAPKKKKTTYKPKIEKKELPTLAPPPKPTPKPAPPKTPPEKRIISSFVKKGASLPTKPPPPPQPTKAPPIFKRKPKPKPEDDDDEYETITFPNPNMSIFLEFTIKTKVFHIECTDCVKEAIISDDPRFRYHDPDSDPSAEFVFTILKPAKPKKKKSAFPTNLEVEETVVIH